MTTTMEATMGNGFVIEVQVDGRWTRNAACLAYAPVYATEDEADEAGEALEREHDDGSWSAWRVVRVPVTMWAVIEADTTNYGRVLSLHETEDAADDALAALADGVRRRYPNALTHLMYRVRPVGTDVEVGDRIRA